VNNNLSPFDYIKNHHEAPQLPDDNSHYKWIKNFISRCIAHFTSAQNTFNNNVAAAVKDVNDNLHYLAEKQNVLSEKINNSFTALDNRQDDIVKFLETLTNDNKFLKQKQEEIEKLVQSTFSDVDNRQDSLIENIKSTNKEIKNLDKRHSDVVKSFETLTEANDFLKQKQEEIEKFVQSTFFDVDNRQNSLIENIKSTNKKVKNLDKRHSDVVKSFETLTDTNNFLKQKQEEIEKFVRSTFSDIDNRQNSLVENIKSTNKEVKNLCNRQNNIIKNVSKQIKNVDNRQNDVVKSFETLTDTSNFLKQKQEEIEKFVQSTFSDVDNRQNSLVERLGTMNDKISTIFGQAEKIKNLHLLYEQIAKQNKDIKNIVSELINSSDKNSLSGIKNELKNIVDDSLYVNYEKAFRGSEIIIKKRLTYYIDKLKNTKTTADKYILDVGCGRGEFVSLLMENKFHAKGIDTNSVAVQHAVKNKLPVKKGDLFNVLKKCKDNSLPVISAFHVIEHLQHNDMLSFFRIAKKKLQPNGKLLLETPNMLSLFVAACDFYKDPTHIRPLHPATLQFHLNEIGFSEVKVDFLHPFSESEQLKILKNSTASNNNFIKLNNLIFGARDCAIIAEK